MERQSELRKPKKDVNTRKSVVILDDHPLVCRGLEELLSTTDDLEVVAAFGTASEALKVLQRYVPDLLILDLSLPGMSGFDFLKDMQINYPDIPVMVLSMYEETVYAERLLRQGAKGYIMKKESGDTIIEAIRCVLEGGIYVSQDVTSRMLLRFTSNNHSSDERMGHELLGDRELQVYTLIGEGHATSEIAEKLGLSPKTVQTHRERIRAKLGLKNSSELSYSAILWRIEGAASGASG